MSQNPYDEVLYPGYPFAQTHPDRLAAMGRLFGMNPAPVERCRVLELGCGDGGNLIPMAYALPASEFVGVDLGARGIAKGQQTIETLGMSNVRLECLDILEADADLGKFDYIIAHGVYSWVPPAVQRRMLAICGESLNAHGVAFISYAVYPGAHVRTMVAEMLQYHARRFSAPAEQIEQTRAMLAFLSAGHSTVRQEAELLADRPAPSLFHDDLAEGQSPLYFREFVERAEGHGLQYLGEADFFEMLDSAEPPEVSSMLRKMTLDPLEMEQYLDFLKCRRFRQTLLCRAEVPLKRRLESAQMKQFYVGTGHHLNRQPEKTPSDHPVAKAALAALIDVWPAVLSFDELLDQVRARAGAFADDDLLLCDMVLGFFACGLFQLHTRRTLFATRVTERPRASALARYQAVTEVFVTSRCHTAVKLEDELSVRLLRALDGTRDRAALLEELGASAVTMEDLERSLQNLAKLALLEE